MSRKDRQGSAEVAPEEEEACMIDDVWAAGLKQWPEGLHDLDKGVFHIINILHTRHEIGKI